jgi:putative glutamine amidotransferase
LASGKPILGICRGGQLINVALGGTLWQDLPSQFPSEIHHVQKEEKFATSHSVSILPDTPLAAITGKNRITANSFHHQAAHKLGEGLRVMALADDGVVEAMYLPGHPFLWALQWHPERIYDIDADARALFTSFIEACK